MDVKACHRVFVIEQRNMFRRQTKSHVRSCFFLRPLRRPEDFFFIFSFSILFFLMLADQNFSKSRNFYLIAIQYS